MLFFALLAAALAVPSPAASETPSPQRVLALIRSTFRSHRPPPPFETYTIERKQKASNGYPDPTGSYTKHVWVRNADRAALTRLVFRDDARGPLTFDRPAFNEERDPGPPTADVFEPAPPRSQPVSFVPTPEPHTTLPPVIGGVRTLVEFEYTVTSMAVEGSELHLHVEPRRDPDRNRIREIWADRKTYELRKLAATDKLFYGDGHRSTVFPLGFTITMSSVDGIPVVSEIRGIVGGGYNDDGQVVDFYFRDIIFPTSLPAWYFNARDYAAHQADAPL